MLVIRELNVEKFIEEFNGVTRRRTVSDILVDVFKDAEIEKPAELGISDDDIARYLGRFGCDTISIGERMREYLTDDDIETLKMKIRTNNVISNELSHLLR